jgi:hypothetical protein
MSAPAGVRVRSPQPDENAWIGEHGITIHDELEFELAAERAAPI